MITGNKLTAIGDKVWIKATIPLIGVTLISDYVDDVEGETASCYFEKKFRYSKNGQRFTAFQELSSENLQAIQISATEIFNFEFQYSLKATSVLSTVPELTFNSVTLMGDIVEINCGPLYNESIFGQWFDCLDSNQWCFNVTGKLFEKGIVPSYIERGDGSDDEDYLAFWKTVACFFAWIVHFSRKIGDFDQNESLYADFLAQRNLFFCDKGSQLTELKILGENYIKEIQRRGTLRIVDEQHTDYNEDYPINGELLRLICWQPFEEFIFNLVPDKYFGWNIGNSSPLFRSISAQHTLNKSWFPGGSILDTAVLPIIKRDDVSIVDESGVGVLKIEGVSDNDVSGIGGKNTQSQLQEEFRDYALRINPTTNYEISFWVKMSALGEYFSFGIYTYDKNYNLLSLINNEDGSISNNFFFSKISTNIIGEYYFVRGILYNFFSDNLPDKKLNIGYGNHLRIGDLNANYILPLILNDQPQSSVAQNELFIKNIQIKPTSTPFSTGFLQVNNFIQVWLRQNNESILPRYERYNLLFRKITDDSDPDFESTTVLRTTTRFAWERCEKGFYIESSAFPEGTYISDVNFFENEDTPNRSASSDVLGIASRTYNVKFSNVFNDSTGELASGKGIYIIVKGPPTYPVLEEKMREYLLPYNTTFKNIY